MEKLGRTVAVAVALTVKIGNGKSSVDDDIVDDCGLVCCAMVATMWHSS